MSVVKGLQRSQEILLKLAEHPDCGELTGYDKIALRIFAELVGRAIKRYKSEAARTRQYHK